MTAPMDADNELAVTSRRNFLRESGALMGGAVLGGLAGNTALAATDAGTMERGPLCCRAINRNPIDRSGN